MNVNYFSDSPCPVTIELISFFNCFVFNNCRDHSFNIQQIRDLNIAKISRWVLLACCLPPTFSLSWVPFGPTLPSLCCYRLTCADPPPCPVSGQSLLSPALEMFSLQLSSLNQQGQAQCHSPSIFCWVCVCVSVIVFFPPSIRTPTLSSQSLNWLYPLGILKVQSALQNDFTHAKATSWVASPPPHLPTLWFFIAVPI